MRFPGVSSFQRIPRLTIFGRSVLLVVLEVSANALCWIVAGILFGRSRETQPILSLALLAWTLGLRHALDADHIRYTRPKNLVFSLYDLRSSAIDNATRGLINLGQLPVTCGLFFSLGHSTIVVVVNVAIAISSDIYDKIGGVGEVGGIVGAAVSGSFLFIVGLANSIILWRILKQRRRRQRQQEAGTTDPEEVEDPKHNHMFMMRLIGPVINFVDRPWKMYPVGFLFGFGFDTASSIALLAVSALAKKGSNGESIPAGDIIILPLLFTAGMTLIDSLDSILMLYSYSGFPETSLTIFEKRVALPNSVPDSPVTPASECALTDDTLLVSAVSVDENNLSNKASELKVKLNMMSGLSIVLTLLSILVAFSISLITIMGLIGENCAKCQEAAEAEDGGGLAGSWWRGWARANDNSGYIGAAIVGSFVVIVAGWYGGGWAVRKFKGRSQNVSLE